MAFRALTQIIGLCINLGGGIAAKHRGIPSQNRMVDAMSNLIKRLISAMQLFSTAVMCAVIAESLADTSMENAMIHATMYNNHMHALSKEIEILKFKNPAQISFADETKTEKEK